jgi:PKD domain
VAEPTYLAAPVGGRPGPGAPSSMSGRSPLIRDPRKCSTVRTRTGAPAAGVLALGACLVLLLCSGALATPGPHSNISVAGGERSTAPGSAPITLNLAASPSKGTAPLTVSFWANASGGAPPYRFSWDFGDGNTSPQADPTHWYAYVGNYTATATVQDTAQATLTRTVTVDVHAGPLVVSLAVLSSAPENSRVATLHAGVTGGEPPFLYTWEFGDGAGLVSSSAVINHTYPAGGSYSASVQVTDGQGVVAVGVASVTIASSGGLSSACLWTTASCAPFGVSYTAAGIVVAALVAVAVVAVWGLSRPSRSSRQDLARPRQTASTNGGLAQFGQTGPPPAPGSAAVAMPSPTAPPPTVAPPPPPGVSSNGRPMSEQILIHLYRQGVPDPNSTVPASFTQDGLALALGRPQSAFARALLRLEEAGMVRVEIAHVIGRTRRAKTYRLTPKGESAARRLGAADAHRRPVD